MEKPALYKKVPLKEVNNRGSINLTVEEDTQIRATLARFFELFIAKHM